MTDLQHSSKIHSQHLARKAIVYLRQSSEKQVKENTESQRLQYALVDRAMDLGFKQVDVIDSDLGSSAGLGAARREGFDRLIASVAGGEVAIVLSREASRLLRTDKDWCQLLEVCQLFGTLIGFQYFLQPTMRKMLRVRLISMILKFHFIEFHLKI